MEVILIEGMASARGRVGAWGIRQEGAADADCDTLLRRLKALLKGSGKS